MDRVLLLVHDFYLTINCILIEKCQSRLFLIQWTKNLSWDRLYHESASDEENTFLESNKSQVLIGRDSKRCFFFLPVVFLHFIRLNHHYITSMTAYPVAFSIYSRGASYWCSYSLPSRQFPGKNVCVSR